MNEPAAGAGVNIPLWWRLAVSFVVGTVAGSTFLFIYLTWRRSHDHPPLFTPRPADLVGRWEGQESWGTTFVVTRRADGTFTETRDYSRADVSHQPPTATAEGRYAVDGTSFGFYYTKSSDPARLNQPPVVVVLHDCTPTELNYSMDEGNGCRELKK